MPPDAASIARYAKQRRQHGGREGCPKADADAALKARPGRVIFIAMPKTSLNLRLRKCAAAGDLVLVPTNSKTAIIYFGEMLVASLLAIVLLAISQLRMSSDAVLFAGGVVAWTLSLPFSSCPRLLKRGYSTSIIAKRDGLGISNGFTPRVTPITLWTSWSGSSVV